MIHTNVPAPKKPKARLVATGEIIRKNGDRIPIKMLGDTDMTQEELAEQFRIEYEEQKKTEVK